MTDQSIQIAWTTVGSEADAVLLAEAVIGSRLAACVQIDSPIQSTYPWKGRVEKETEYRIWIKYPAHQDAELQKLMGRVHPYETPQWIAVEAASLGQAYADWVIRETKA